DDRKYYFDILSDEKSLIPKNWPIHSKVNFILQLGYKVRKLKVSLPLKERAKSKVIQSVVIGLWH
uniref:hypothetical protein n=1 Tax=Vibrio hyugaensis TaxID=1534743 RepID=UPI001E5D08A1